MAADAEVVVLNAVSEKRRVKDGGFKIASGKLYYGKGEEYVEMSGVTIQAGTEYRLVRELDFTDEKALKSSYFVYDASGKLLGSATQVEMAAIDLPITSINLGVKKVSGNPEAALLPDETVLCCGPLLINDGKMEEMLTTDFHMKPHPRTAIGITKDGRLLLVTVDGRFKDKAIGMSTTLLQEYMYLLGAYEALNLDGGGSTAMWIEGYGIVNHTCDGLNWENPKERAVSSIIYIK
jgi:exopolysaccharide biosynthesis protein